MINKEIWDWLFDNYAKQNYDGFGVQSDAVDQLCNDMKQLCQDIVEEEIDLIKDFKYNW
ncbi:MAG: hypothetical protein ACRDBG_09640 [Waterburya sp.]